MHLTFGSALKGCPTGLSTGLSATARAARTLLLGAVLSTALIGGAHAEKIFRNGNDGEPQSMDPHYVSTVQTSRVTDDMYLNLLTWGPKGNAIPGAAESWTISPDGLTYTFKIRNHTWSDGVPVTAGDFAYSFQRLLDPASGTEYASLLYIIKGAEEYNKGKGKAEDLGVKVIDDHTLEVTLAAPAPYFLSQLTHQTAAPVPKHVIDKVGKDWTKPENIVVNGPFKLVEWLPNVHTKLMKNDKFYDAANVKLDEVIYYTHEDRTAAQKRFRAGELDVVRDIASEQIDWLKSNMKDELRIAPYGGVYDYAFNTTKKPFDDVRVRRALSMVVDAEAITDKVLKTGELPAYSYVPPGTGNYTTPATVDWKGKPYKERVEEAKKLLAEAGYSKDKPLKFTLRYNTSENHKRIAIAVAAMWKQLGVQADLFNTEGKIHYADLKQRNFEVAREGWIADYDDPQNFLFKMEGKTGPLNYSGYNNPEYNALLDKAAMMTDLPARAEVLKQAEALAMRDVPVVPIYYYVSKQLISPKVVGWSDNTPDKHPSRFLDLKP